MTKKQLDSKQMLIQIALDGDKKNSDENGIFLSINNSL